MRAARLVREHTVATPTPAGEAEARIAPVLVKPRGRARTAIIWGSLGFLTGAFCWHAIGFWGFVSEVVLNGSVQERRAVAFAQASVPPLPPLDTQSQPPMPTVYLVDATSCTALVLDRLSNRTQQVPCPPSGLALRLEASGTREDLARLAPAPRVQTIGYRRESDYRPE
jgi:hypothetical protein